MNNSNYPPGSSTPQAPWFDDDSKWTEWAFHEKYQCIRCLRDTEVDEYYVCEACFIPEELTDLDYLDE